MNLVVAGERARRGPVPNAQECSAYRFAEVASSSSGSRSY